MLNKIASIISKKLKKEYIADVEISFFEDTITINDVMNRFYSDKISTIFYKSRTFTIADIFNKYDLSFEEIENFLININSFNVPYILDVYDNNNGWLSYHSLKYILVYFNDDKTIIDSIFDFEIDDYYNEKLFLKIPELKNNIDVSKILSLT